MEVHDIINLEELMRSELLMGQILKNVTISGGKLEGISLLTVDNINIKVNKCMDITMSSFGCVICMQGVPMR